MLSKSEKDNLLNEINWEQIAHDKDKSGAVRVLVELMASTDQTDVDGEIAFNMIQAISTYGHVGTLIFDFLTDDDIQDTSKANLNVQYLASSMCLVGMEMLNRCNKKDRKRALRAIEKAATLGNVKTYDFT